MGSGRKICIWNENDKAVVKGLMFLSMLDYYYSVHHYISYVW